MIVGPDLNPGPFGWTDTELDHSNRHTSICFAQRAQLSAIVLWASASSSWPKSRFEIGSCSLRVSCSRGNRERRQTLFVDHGAAADRWSDFGPSGRWSALMIADRSPVACCCCPGGPRKNLACTSECNSDWLSNKSYFPLFEKSNPCSAGQGAGGHWISRWHQGHSNRFDCWRSDDAFDHLMARCRFERAIHLLILATVGYFPSLMYKPSNFIFYFLF